MPFHGFSWMPFGGGDGLTQGLFGPFDDVLLREAERAISSANDQLIGIIGAVPTSFLPTAGTLEAAAPLRSTAQQPLLGGSSLCGCAPKPGPCDPTFISDDFTGSAFGANPCTGDPRYPRASARMIDGQAVRVCAPARKKPRMNPLNARAAGRATRRLVSLKKSMKRIDKALKAAARM